MATQLSPMRDPQGSEKPFSDPLTAFHIQGFGFGNVIALATIPLFLILFAVLSYHDVERVFESYLLLFVLNTLFLSIIPLVVSYFSLRAYLASGHVSLLMLGNGALSLGLGSVLASLTPYFGGGPNTIVTMHNTAALLSGLFHAVGAAQALDRSQKQTIPERTGLYGRFSGILMVLFFGSLFFAVLKGATPTFFVQGVGPTHLRQLVLGTAIGCFGLSAASLAAVFAISRSRFVSWYWMGLALIAVGLMCVFVQKSVGSDVGWLGRIAQYIGCSYLLVAVIAARRQLDKRDPSFVSNLWTFFFNNLEVMIAKRTQELAEANQELGLEIAARKEAEQALREAHDDLERQVEDRTSELRVSNEQLRLEIGERKKAHEALERTRNTLAEAQKIAHLGSFE
ncbi:MAG TPA: hypothetical protein VK463_04775, partial [Desulfomonilaceae bacterium]|nr:hypothetical protein [Desulfomonilaceae bacterium]